MPTLRELAQQKYKFTGSGTEPIQAVSPEGSVFSFNFEQPKESIKPKPSFNYEQMVRQNYKRRDEFENEVFKQIGFNPFQVSIIDEINRFDKGDGIKHFFDATFDGIMTWRDRRRMTPEQRQFWNLALKNAHANIAAQVKEHREIGLKKYELMMTRFDKEAEMVLRAKPLDFKLKQSLQKIEKQEKKDKAAFALKRARDNFNIVNDGLKRMLKGKEEVKKKLKNLSELEQKVINFDDYSYKEELYERMPPSTLALININREELGMPPIVEIPYEKEDSTQSFYYVPKNMIPDELISEEPTQHNETIRSKISSFTTADEFVAYVEKEANKREQKQPGSGIEFAKKTTRLLAELNPELFIEIKEKYKKKK